MRRQSGHTQRVSARSAQRRPRREENARVTQRGGRGQRKPYFVKRFLLVTAAEVVKATAQASAAVKAFLAILRPVALVLRGS